MEKGELKENFEQGIETLGDLYTLGDSSLYPLIDRLHFHFNEINSIQEKPRKTSDFRSLKKLFLNSLNENILEFFRDKGRGVKVDFVDLLDNPNLESLDHLTASFPLAGEVCSLFSFQKNIKITLRNNSFSFRGKVPFDLDLESLREETYRLTRVFLKNKILFTFDLFESSREAGLFDIQFDFHLQNKGQSPCLIQVNRNHVLSLSGVIKKFQRSSESLEKIGDHNVFVLKDDLEVAKLDRITFLNCYQDKNYELFHFPFLFRPISLIMRGYNSSQEEEYLSENDGALESSNNLLFEIDLFSLLKK